ncbi:hypothetical protein EHS13_30110 [Paenibacillus psychroresistens]|uniref:Uncharacterized protein n=1 Tax=Paenibacillus psychroresistens TaxID=1778678 RepID=A0A6B8RSX4_9BACL|nr:hypothetical protein [Paenibacillus psychroresistens]QGQ98832.1 hypothetical protein EHS13_30110 [Paenibacillus psychroresistens]
MKTSELSAIEFSARFGKDKIIPGPFSYFLCDNGLGLIKDNIKKSIEVLAAAEISHVELTLEDELALLSLVCGEFSEEIIIPKHDTLMDYEAREKSTSRNQNTIWGLFFTFIVICLVICVYIFR